jgi:hypothetical protein
MMGQAIGGLDRSALSAAVLQTSRPGHRRTEHFEEEYLAFLKRHECYFDEKYLWD